MAYYKKFEELPCWQHARKFASEAHKVVEGSDICKNFKLRDQMLGSSGSVMDNIAEGFDRKSKAEFVDFYFIQKAQVRNFGHNFIARSTQAVLLQLTLKC